MLGVNFPISDDLKPFVLDAETLTRQGPWWTAILLISNPDPENNNSYIELYRWQSTSYGWKIRKRFTFRKAKEINSAIEVLGRFVKKLEDE